MNVTLFLYAHFLSGKYLPAQSQLQIKNEVWNASNISRRSSVFMVNFEHIPHLFLLLILKRWKSTECFDPFMCNVEKGQKWSKNLVNKARFLEYICPFFNIKHERIKIAWV